MATIRFEVLSVKRNPAEINIRFSAGRKKDYSAKSGLFVDPDRWSNKTESIKQRLINNDEDDLLDSKVKSLRDLIEVSYKSSAGDVSREWLLSVIDGFHNKKKEGESKTLNEYITKFIQDAKDGNRKNKGGVNYVPGTVRSWEGFQRIFNEYMGIYTDERIEEFRKQEKALRPRKILDFEDITIDFYNSFVSFLSNEGYQVNTIGRFIKILKYIMQKALIEKKHKNREFQEGAFSGFTEEAFTVYLTAEEVEKIYKHDLTKYPQMDLARDAFIVLCETALRVSDYSKISLNIQERNKRKFIHLQQTKTGDPVVIPLTRRMEEILKKYGGRLPQVHETYVNRYIKTVASWCGINQKLQWTAQKFGKKYTKTAKKYELITCHTGRRTACSLMYLAGIPPIDIMKISGHKSEKSFLLYIRITPEETADRLSDHPYFREGALKVI